MKRVVSLMLLGVAGLAVGGEPRVPLETWTTTDGKTAEAAFQSIDEAAGTVTILVPRTIELARLDEASRRLAIDSTSFGRSEFQPLAIGLDDPTFRDWLQASKAKREATVANLMFRFLARRNIKAELVAEIETPDRFNQFASRIAGGVTDHITKAPGDKMETGKVFELIVAIIGAADQLEK